MMKTIADLLSHDGQNALGWTLVHSLWQSAVIVLMVIFCLRFIPSTHSRIRYAVACAGLLLFIGTSLMTFAYLTSVRTNHNLLPGPWYPTIEHSVQTELTSSSTGNFFNIISSAIEAKMPLILTLWLGGFLIFGFRLTGGIFYTYKLKSGALPVENEWKDYLNQIRKNLGIDRLVTLGESAAIHAPMVIGYFKPMILIPVGMVTGLTSEQIETIFIHELAHIKRHDYLINFIQSFIETVFFFNPFTWILSNVIRREREYCCDDLVLSQHGSASAYAHALTQLAAVRLSRHTFALPLAEDKNQLLNRIRRIMERSGKNYSGKDRVFIPAMILITGLFCISWLGIQDEKGNKSDPLPAKQDTVIHKNEKSEGDEALRPLLEIPVIPNIPDIQVIIPQLPLEPVDPLLPDLNINAFPDSLPPPRFNFRNQEQWEDFSKSFEDFGNRLEEFYSLEETDPSEFLKEFQKKFDTQDWTIPFDKLNIPEDFLRGFENFEDPESFKNLEKQWEGLRDLQMEHLQNLDMDMGDLEGNFPNNFLQALQKQLIEDGYLKENEKVNSIEWNDGVLKVNGKAIKDADEKKNKELEEQYFGNLFTPSSNDP